MKLLHLTLDSPEANLALDEALLDATDAGGDAILRLWESPQEFVVVGYGNDPALEANLQECRRQGVPVLRRCSGGGTVVQGPGCLNYSVTLPISAAAALETIHGANQFVMEKLRAALRPLLPTRVAIQGHTDLCLESPTGGWIKFSGNAQRRRRNALLFHGTLLLAFDLDRISKLLRAPSIEPEYRSGRSHESFLCNLNLASDRVSAAIALGWSVTEELANVPSIDALMSARYAREAWHRNRK